MGRTLEADYLVVGAGAMGMAFVDALLDHAAVTVTVVDRRHAPGGHWLEAYPFVRLHQASAFYGVASTLLGGGRVQATGPEAGLHERATQPEICAYYARVLDRLTATGRVTFLPCTDFVPPATDDSDGTVVSRVTGERWEVPVRCRVVDGRYLAPSIPAETPPPFAVSEGVRVVPVNELARLEEAPPAYVVVGAGKTATDAVVWLLDRGVDPDAVSWVRPRDPWMFNRAVVQPDPAVFVSMVADIMESARHAGSLEDLFRRMEDAGVMLRIDRQVEPTMAKAPTLATWELDELRRVERVVRRGHLVGVGPGRLTFADGDVPVPRGATVVHCAADGLKYPPLVPVWMPGRITLQPIRTGFPCFGAALVGFVESTGRTDEEKNRICPPTPYGNSLADWARMVVLGGRATAAYSREPDVRAWARGVALDPSRVLPEQEGPALDRARERMAEHAPAGAARLAALMDAAPA